MDECPICLNNLDMSNNDIITLNCCNKNVHLQCLNEWTLSKNNKNISNCILCRKKNDLFLDIKYNIECKIKHDNVEIDNIQHNNKHCCWYLLTCCLGFVLVIL